MVRFITAAGNATAQRVSRGQHVVLFDRPENKGRELKLAHPDIGWLIDTEGHPALPYSVAALLFLRAACEPNEQDVALFAHFPTAQ